MLRLVQSGFGAEAALDDEFESTESGWAEFLKKLTGWRRKRSHAEEKNKTFSRKGAKLAKKNTNFASLAPLCEFFSQRPLLLCMNQSLVQHPHKLRDDPEPFFFRVERPGFKLGIQRHQSDFFVRPCAVHALRFIARIALHCVAIVRSAP